MWNQRVANSLRLMPLGSWCRVMPKNTKTTQHGPRNDWLTESMTVVVSTVVWRTSSLTGCDCLSSKFVSATSGSPTCWGGPDQSWVFLKQPFNATVEGPLLGLQKPMCSRPENEIAALIFFASVALTSSAAFCKNGTVPD